MLAPTYNITVRAQAQRRQNEKLILNKMDEKILITPNYVFSYHFCPLLQNVYQQCDQIDVGS